MEIRRVENMAGGKGHVIIKDLLGEKELNGKCRMYAEVTVEPGCSLGYHEHHGERDSASGEAGRRDLYPQWQRPRPGEYWGIQPDFYGINYPGLKRINLEERVYGVSN